ncbi:DsrE family protein [Ramlibacter rhizophilus]|uniref:Multidrug transporter n=1 Tax=Ramlibacter rhizophilus TaxID=1781167 RepID=A0A4Z0BZR2_9BURK|nr:DsrE family protein [Ramlibacter rhizophilus]TFZ03485.1 multidrug transporter [Ramlibacter rhizophilus]
MRFLVHITCGPEQPTRAALAFFVARAAVEEGHETSVFLAGDAVQLLRDAVLDAAVGLGTGSLREHYDKLVAGGAKFYLSGGSSKARGVSDADLAGKSFEFGNPTLLVRLAAENDKVLCY